MSSPDSASPPGRFAFIIPVRHPNGHKVRDFSVIEAVLATTVASLSAHRAPDTHIVIVGHGAAPRGLTKAPRTHWLDVSRSTAFDADRSPVEIDKGLKYLIGILFVDRCLAAEHIMLMDADDYVNVDLASELARLDCAGYDGFLIQSGAHVTVAVTPPDRVTLGHAYLVRDFDRSCGSCRVFRASVLRSHCRILRAERYGRFQDEAVSTCFQGGISASALESFLYAVASGGARAFQLLEVLGRHLNQQTHFRFLPCPIVGAAKGCGHGNHDGPRHGEVHREKVLGEIPIEEFCRIFGLDGPELQRCDLRERWESSQNAEAMNHNANIRPA